MYRNTARQSDFAYRVHPLYWLVVAVLLCISTSRSLHANDDKEWSGVAVSYNIRHGRGMDGKLNLERTADVLRNLTPDFVALQEVDNKVRRSESVDQAAFLGKTLGMNHAFGKFMDYDGGEYGLAILSKHTIAKTMVVELPRGNEPRVALVVWAELPNKQQVAIVSLHFDWVRDDRFRFAQATELKTFLESLDVPYLLIGDFNDQRDSRTLKLLAENAVEAVKPIENRFTFPSDKPNIEIDFLFGSPAKRWEFTATEVVAETMASDHRPIATKFRLQFP
ncbi:endonuclease/exonuclease/phosphatase family protein [Pirellulaceae bacterium SH449]